MLKSGHRYVVYIKLTSKVSSEEKYSYASLNLNVKYDYIYVDFP